MSDKISKEEEAQMLEALTREMFGHCCMQFSAAFVSAARSPHIKPAHLSNALYGILGAISHAIDDKVWKEMIACKPCGHPDCDCHEGMNEFMGYMDKLREKAKEIVNLRKGEQSREE